MKRLIISSLTVTSVLFSTGCAGKFYKGNFQNFIFEKFDKNEDGKLSKKEHFKLAFSRHQRIDDNVTKSEIVEQAKKEFIKLDKNNDGVLSKNEYKKQKTCLKNKE